jgi:hypothetical protein
MADKGDHPGYHIDPSDFYKDLKKDKETSSGIIDNKMKVDDQNLSSENRKANVNQDFSKVTRSSEKDPKS